MDILSCLVGVMLFLVIYSVLQLGSAAYEAHVPVVRAVPPGSEPVLIVTRDGTLRPVDIRRPLNELLTGLEIVRSTDVPVFVDQANARPTVDRYFEYSLTYDERFRELGDPMGTLALEIREREGAVGEGVEQLGAGSVYGRLLDGLDPDEHWLAFEVDPTGVDVFRRARDMAIEAGFTVMWSPMEITFPFTHQLSGGSPTNLLRSRQTQSKPQR